MKSSFFHVVNDNQEIIETSYFDTEQADRGLFFLSWNGGAARLLMPDNQRGEIDEMMSGEIVVISSGMRDGIDLLEIMFDDHSSAPMAITFSAEQADRKIIEGTEKIFPFSVWCREEGRLKKLAQWPAHYRIVDEIPCLQPWEENKGGGR